MRWGFRIVGMTAALLLAAGCQPQPVKIDRAAIAAEASELMDLGPAPSSMLSVTDGSIHGDMWSEEEGIYFRVWNNSGVIDYLFAPRDPVRFSTSRPVEYTFEALGHGMYRYKTANLTAPG